MSARYAELSARIDSVDQLGAVVGALRGIAAARAQRSRAQLDGVRDYTQTVGAAIAAALALLPAQTPPTPAADAARLLLLFGAEQGFAGAYSEQVLDAAGDDAAQAQLLLVGRRGERAAAARGWRAAWAAPGLAHVDGATALAERIAAELLRRLGSSGGRVELVYARPADGSAIVVERRSLLPLDLRRFGRAPRAQAPLVQLPPAQLLEGLALEYLRAELTAAALESFAAENTARLQAMSAARDNIAHTLDGLRRAAHIARQDEITAEVVELAAGSIAVSARG